MKVLIIALLSASFSFSAPKSINPEKVIYPLFEVFSKYWLWGDDHVKVYGLEFNHRAREPENRYEERGKSHIIPKDFFLQTQMRAQSVFEATPGDSSNAYGTAFHVGGNYILTNQHVLSVSRKNTQHCDGFKIRLNPNQYKATLYCKEVVKCNREMDYCLIEMWGGPYYSLDKQKAPLLNWAPEYHPEKPVMAIGNTQGFGIHASKGLGFISTSWGVKFHAPVFGGNSGGPVFNEAGEVIAVVRAQSSDLYSPRAYNAAIRLIDIKNDLEASLGKDHPALQAINFKPEPKPESEPALPEALEDSVQVEDLAHL